MNVLDEDTLRRWPLPVGGDGDKFDRGTVVVIGGTPTTPGAVILAGIAAMRMGAGRLRIVTAESTATAVAVAVPEAMVVALPIASDGRASGTTDDFGQALADVDAVVIGPGLFSEDVARGLLEMMLCALPGNARIVVDAVAIRALPTLAGSHIESLANRLVITPNRQEAEDLVGNGAATSDDTLCAAARKCGAVATSFGRVCTPTGQAWQYTAACAGLGTSGSGDVLAGLVAGAACLTADPAQAACWATFAHMEAGRRLSQRVGEIGYLARELLDEIPQCLPTDV